MTTILIIDDHAENREVLIAMLTHRGYRLLQASGGDEGLAIAHDEKPDLIIADVLMPKMDGFEFVRRLRADPKVARSKVIFYTASYIEDESRALAKACGVDLMIIKPAEPELVLKTVDLALGTKARAIKMPEHEFERDHLRLVNDKLAQKVEELDLLAQKLQQEVTDRKAAQETLERLKQHHELILNSAGEGIHGLNLKGEIIFENPTACELLGWKADEILGKPAHVTIHHSHADGSDYPLEECPIYASMRDGATRRVTNDVFWRKEGTCFRVDYVSAPMKDRHGEITGTIVTFKDITEQFAAEARLKLHEQQYRLLFETNPNPMWVFDAATLQILAVNDDAVKQYGFSREEFLALSLPDLRPAGEVQQLNQSLSGPRAPAHFSGEFHHIRKDGAVITVEVYSSPLIWNGVAARMVTAIDVTQRRGIEAELRATHGRLRELLAHTPAVIYSLAIEGENVRPVFVSENMERLLGVTADKATSFEWWLDSLHPEDRDRAVDVLKKSSSSEGYSMRYRIRHHDGSYHWIEDNSRLIRDADGQPKELVGVWTDVTERKKTEERLREQAEIIDGAQDAIFIRNYGDMRITFWNKAAERLYGWGAEEVLGRTDVTTLADPEQANTIMSILHNTDEFRGEVKQLSKDGKELITQARVTLVRNADGTARSVLIICTDITEQKKLETQLLRAQRLESIGTLASGVAHDLNNIITPILVCAETLRDDLSAEDRQSAINLIDQSARRGASVVKQVLTFARGIEGKRVVINPRHLLEETVDISRRTFPKSIELRTHYPEDLWSIEGDPTQLHRVLLNLSVNARDAMPNGGSIVFAAENVDLDESYAATMPGAKKGPHVLLRATDTGTGMSRATAEKIFDPFFTTKEVGKGTGLGLSTALGIVKSHGGFLSVSSELGRGTTFRIYLPAVDAETAHVQPAGPKLMKGNNELVLIVDDEEMVREVTKKTLEKNNYRCLEAKDGPEALAIFAQQMDAIALVFSDLTLPHMDGITLVRAARKMKPNMPIIVSSGQGEPAGMGELQALGGTNFLPKPYDTGKLLAAVHEALAARR